MAIITTNKINWRNFWICFAISMGQVAFGYPSSIIGTTLGQPSFLLYMGLIDAEGVLQGNAEDLIGATSGVFQAGAVFGVLGGSWVMDKWGRKAGVIYCATLSLVGGALLCAAQDIGMFIAFRFFAGAGSWGFLALTPVYTAELAPPALRGFFVGMNGVLIALGYSIASYMGLAFFYSTDPSTQWRGPLGVALVWPALMLVIICFVPESPRYLLMKGKTEEAWKIVSSLHSDPSDPDEEFARGEFFQMQKQAEMDRTLNPSWLEMFRKPSYRKRVIMGMTFAFIGQSTAILVVNNYGPTFYKALGFGTRDQLILQCGWITGGIPANFVGAWVMDRFGRRPLMIFGVAGCCAMLCIEAAIVSLYAAEGTNKAGLGVGVAAFYTFLIIYSVGVDVCGVVFYSELFPNHIRAKGVALAVMSIALTDLVYLQATATAFANIGWKFFLVFIIISGLGSIWAYVYIPETKGVPLEELAQLFGDEDEVVVYLRDVHIDRNTHELIMSRHNGGDNELSRVVTELHKRNAVTVENASPPAESHSSAHSKV
jgi:sugar porter (SP) family MFS transporter